MILIIDNYDSFVYNIGRYIRQLGVETIIKRNDELNIAQIKQLAPSHIIISPGPCTPNEAGISLEIIKYFANKIPLLGICLGHQAMGQAYGGKIIRALKPMHGKTSLIMHHQKNIFNHIKNPLIVMRYHSLIVTDLPAELIITAKSEQDEIMALQHIKYPVYGLQFHPESILTESGYELLKNFLKV